MPEHHRVHLPASLNDPTCPKAITAAAEEYGRLRDEHRTADRELAKIKAKRESLEEADAQAGADALRAGKAMPASKAAKITPEIEDHQRRVKALSKAVDDSFGGLLAAVQAHRSMWAAALEEAADQDREELLEAVDALEQAAAVLTSRLSLRSWALRFPEAPRNAAVGRAESLRRPNGESVRFDELVGALREAVEPPKPSPSGLRPAVR